MSERSERMTDPEGRVPTPDEAELILQRFIDSHFHRDGNPCHARFTIPADVDRDDDCLMDSFIKDYRRLESDLATANERVRVAREGKDQAYEERNRLVALLAYLFPSGIARTAIPGWSEDWHGCVYIDFPWGQASWHYHDSQADMFKHLPPYKGEWDGHTTDEKYAKIADATLSRLNARDGGEEGER